MSRIVISIAGHFSESLSTPTLAGHFLGKIGGIVRIPGRTGDSGGKDQEGGPGAQGARNTLPATRKSETSNFLGRFAFAVAF